MKKIDPHVYNKEYFDSDHCEGYFEYKKNKLSYVKQLEIDLLQLKKDDLILDIGCGRGDIPHYLSKKGYNFWATDYAADAISMTKSRVAHKYKQQIILADARKVNLKGIKFNKIISADVIEHMTYQDALKVVNRAYDQLENGGIFLIHTAPNMWFKKYTYPISRFIFKILRYREIVKKLDENIAATHDYHIDEYSPLDLLRLMKRSKFKKFKVWVNRNAVRNESTNYLDPIKKSPLLGLGIWIINNSPLIYLFGNDLFVIGFKE